MKKRRILILGIDDYNLYELSKVDHSAQYDFITLFNQKEIQDRASLDIEEIIKVAKDKIQAYDNDIDAIISFFDFPFTLLSFYLSDVYNLRGPTLVQGLKCEHKYWSRVLQKEVIPENIPDFVLVNPDKTDTIQQVNLTPPFWIKPVKSYGSILGFKINDQRDFKDAIQRIRSGLSRLAKPFNTLIRKAELPHEIKHVDGNYCLAEDIIDGHQATLSGYVYNYKIETYGIVDSINYPNSSSFFYYFFPSELPSRVKERMHEIAKRVMQHIGFNNSPFNIEFFYNENTDDIKLLEINPRMSQSHADLYRKVKKYPNHQVLIQCALGEKPNLDSNKGKYKCAAKFHYRVFHDGIVERVPSKEELQSIKSDYPDIILSISYDKGEKLSGEKVSESYSYTLATIFIGGQSKEELLNTYDHIIESLNIRIRKI